MRIVLRSAGLLLLVLPFLPAQRIFGESPAPAGLVPVRVWLLGMFIVLGLALVLSLLFAVQLQRAGAAVMRWVRGFEDGRFAAVCICLICTELVLISAFAFSFRYHLIDSAAQLFQARIFAGGEVSGTLPAPAAFFYVQNMVLAGSRWYSQYPPLHPLLLAAGELLGASWLVPVVLSGLSALVIYALAGRMYGATAAKITLGLLVVCPFFLFVGASYMNHISSMLFLACALYAYVRWNEDGGGGWSVAVGVFLGCAALVRPLSVLAVGIVLCAAGLAFGRRGARGILCGAAGLAVPAALGLYYNKLTTGAAFLPGYLRLWGASHGLGFHETPWGELHTFGRGVGSQAADLVRLNEYLFEWPVPALLPLGLYFFFARKAAKYDVLLLAGFFSIPLAYVFYWHRDAFLGPRFLFCSLVFLLPLYAHVLERGFAALSGRKLKMRGMAQPLSADVFAGVFLALCFLYAVFFGMPQRFMIYASSQASAKEDIAEAARRRGVARAVVFVPVSWGNRLIAGLREAGVSAALVEKAYRSVDHCLLQQMLNAYSSGRIDGAVLIERIERATRNEPRAERVMFNGDASLRLRRDLVLAAVCADELRYDQQGFIDYTVHLLENNATLNGDIVVARDLRARNAELTRVFADRPAYLYRKGEFVPLAEE